MSVGPSTPPGDGGPRSVEEARLDLWVAVWEYKEAHFVTSLERTSDKLDVALDAYAAAVRADEREAVYAIEADIANDPRHNHDQCMGARMVGAVLRSRAKAASDAARGRPLG